MSELIEPVLSKEDILLPGSSSLLADNDSWVDFLRLHIFPQHVRNGNTVDIGAPLSGWF